MARPGLAIAAVAAGVLCAIAVSAHEQAGKGSKDPDRMDFATMHAQMCKDRYAREVGHAAYLEAKLSLSAAQQPLFDAWKTAMLQSADAEAKGCAAAAPPSSAPGILDAMKLEESMLEGRLNALHAELPALTALYQSLSPEQRQSLDSGNMFFIGGPQGRRMMIMRKDEGHPPLPMMDDDHGA